MVYRTRYDPDGDVLLIVFRDGGSSTTQMKRKIWSYITERGGDLDDRDIECQ